MPKLKCFDKVDLPELAKEFNGKYKDGMTRLEQVAIGTEIAMKYHEQLFNEQQDVLAKMGAKKKAKYEGGYDLKPIQDAVENSKVVPEKTVEAKPEKKKEAPAKKETKEDAARKKKMNDAAMNPWPGFDYLYPGTTKEEYRQLRQDYLDQSAASMDKLLDEDIIDGFYSPIVKRVREVKQDKLSATKWKEIVGKGDEAIWTGVKDFLDSKKPDETLSKQEVLDFMKDNRIEIKEVVKGDIDLQKAQKQLDKLKAKKENALEKAKIFTDIGEDAPQKIIEEVTDIEDQIQKLERWAIRESNTKYSDYQLPGEKENYKEVLVTLPTKTSKQVSRRKELAKIDSERPLTKAEQEEYDNLQKITKGENATFKSSHFEEPNILVHLRMNTRTDADGKKVLFLEEIQSDWGQEGKKDGFGDVSLKKGEQYRNQIEEYEGSPVKDIFVKGNEVFYTDSRGEAISVPIYDGKLEMEESGVIDPRANTEYEEAMAAIKGKSGVPAAPFVTDTNAWTKLGLKVALKEAVKQGVDRIAWTTGEQQTERFDLSKIVDKVMYAKRQDGTYDLKVVKKGGSNPESIGKEIPESKIEDYVGKEVAQKIINKEGKDVPHTAFTFLSGLDLKIGGKGMKGFYGSPSEGSLGIVGNVAKSLFKQDIGTTKITTLKDVPEGTTMADIWEAGGMEEFKKKSELNTTQHSIDITPELIQQVQGEGLALFKLLDSGDMLKTKDGLVQTVSQYVDKAQAVLSAVMPGVKVVAHKTSEEYRAETGAPKGSAGRWVVDEKTVHLNMEAITGNEKGANTPIHEAIHAVVDAVYGRDPEVMSELDKQLSELLDEPGLGAVNKHVSQYGERGRNVQNIEGVTEFLTLIAEGKVDASKMPRTTWGKFSKFLNDLFKALGFSFRVNEPNDLRKVAEAIQAAFRDGDLYPLKKMIENSNQAVAKELVALDNLIGNQDAGNDAEITRKLSEIIAKYPDVDPDLLKDYIKEKTGWEWSKVKKIFGEIGVANVYLNEKLKQLGFEEYMAEPEKMKDWVDEADKKIREGFDAEALIESMDSKEPHRPTKVEYIILAKYLGALTSDIEANPTPEKINEYRRKLNIIQRVKSEDARSMAAMAYAEKPATTLADYLTGVGNAQKSELTEKQFEELTQKYNAEKEARQAYEEKLRKLEEAQTKKEAEAVVKEEAKKAKKTKKTKEDFAAEKEKIKAEMKRKLDESKGKLSSSVLFGAERYVAIAPEVAKYVKVLAEEGISNVRDMLDNLRPVVTDVIPDATDRDILDMVVGKYDKPKPSRKAVSENLYNLKQEIRILNQIEDIINGVAPTTEEKKKSQNKRLEELRNQLKQVKSEYASDESKNEQKLKQYKSNIKTRIQELNKQLESGDFTDKKPKPLILDDEAKQLRKEWVEAKKQKELAVLTAEHEALSKKDKAIEAFNKSINVPRTMMATADIGMILIQGGPALAYTKQVKNALYAMSKSAFSQSNFDDLLRDMKDHPRWELMQKLNLAIVDPDSPFSMAQDELFFARNYIDRLGDWVVPGTKNFKPGKVLSEPNKASERAYVMYLNKLRFDIFNKISEQYEDQGMTYENRPDLYEATAKFVNNITGKGNVPGWLKPLTPILSGMFFSPGMIASRVSLMKSMMSLSLDLPVELRKRFWFDMSKFVGSRMAILGLIKFAADLFMDDDDEEKPTVELDPRSSDFGLLKIKNTRFNVWGGFQGYARLIAQMATLEQKSTKTGEIKDLTDMGAYSKDHGDLLLKFTRGKFSPIASYAVDMTSGKDFLGRPVDPFWRSVNMITPMIIPSVYETYKDLGVTGAIASFPATFVGVTSNTYDQLQGDMVEPLDLYDKITKKPYKASPSQMDEYVKAKDSIANSIYARIKDKGNNVDIDDYGDLMLQTNKDGNVVFGYQGDDKWKKKIPLDSLTNKQKQELRRKVNAKATRDAKKKVFKGAESKD